MQHMSESENMAAMAAKKRKASGVNIPEAQRHTVRLVLRVPVDVADELDELAERRGITRSGAVAWLLEDRSTDDRSKADG